MKNEILTAIDKIEKDLLNENYTQYLKKMHNLQVASDKLMTIRKGCDSFWMAEILPLKDYNKILDRILALMDSPYLLYLFIKTLDKPTAKLNNPDCSKETAPVSG